MSQHTNGQQNGEEGSGVADQLRRWRRVDGLDKLRLRATRAIRVCEAIMLDESSSNGERMEAARALTSAVREARKLHAEHEREVKIEEVEEIAAKLNGGA